MALRTNGSWAGFCSVSDLHLIWFKRDLRVRDHAPLAQAAASGGVVLPLYVIEPRVFQAADFDALHWDFVRAGLVELSHGLAQLGGPLQVARGEVVEVLEAVRKAMSPGQLQLWSHEETGNDLTFQRDKAVAQWCRVHRVRWTEFPQNGVVRGLTDRDGWAWHWHQRMKALQAPTPAAFKPVDSRLVDQAEVTWEPVDALPGRAELGLTHQPRTTVSEGGEVAAQATLASFLAGRGRQYHRQMSSPVTAYDACSRLSAYLAWGNLSMKQIVQATRARQAELVENDQHAADGQKFPKAALTAFLSRCHWHCHFMQKLEREPAIEFRAMNPAFDSLRVGEWEGARYAAFCAGQTGFPFVDACLRALQAHGWINFRMRAMLVSFAAYDLWLDWRGFAHWLARQFVDYEPGIHYSQIQMQSGVTGINTMRIYNPIKQGFDQDPEGTFIRRYVPELAGLPTLWVHQPWKAAVSDLTSAGVVLGKTYPSPVMNHHQAVTRARAAFATIRRDPKTQEANRAVYLKHGSRVGPARRRIRGDDSVEFDPPAQLRRRQEQAQMRLFD